MAGELNLKATLHRPAYPVMPVSQQAYLLLEVLPSGVIPGEEAQPVNFCLALDRSGSMAGEKLKALKDAARLVIDRLSGSDRLSVVVFDDADPAELVVPVGPVSDSQAVKRKIDAIEERGGTHMSTGMRLGLQELLRAHTPERVSRMLLLTDGQTWEDQDECRRLAEESRKAGIPIQVVGLGVGVENNWDPKLLEDLARLSGGDWMMVESPDQVIAVFERTLRTLQGTAAANARLTLRMVAGVEPRSVWRITPLISRLDLQAMSATDLQVFLGDVQHGSGQSVLAEVLLPGRSPGTYRLMQADVVYDVPGVGLTEQRSTVDVVLNFVDDPANAAELDQRLMNIIERVAAHRLQTQALDDAAAGDASRATQRLRAAATRLLDLGEVEMARQAEGQAAKLEQGHSLDPAAAQKMRYATKRLTETDY